MDLEIKYKQGTMVVHLEEFLDYRNISKVRKLMCIIRSSYTPDEELKIKNYVQYEIEHFEQKQLELSRCIDGCEQKIRYNERCIYTASTYRSRYKKNTEAWKYHNEDLKKFRVEHKELKAQLRYSMQQYNRNIRNREFYKKIVEI
ncbi:MAG: hypothetical protein R3Y47_02040 [Lachnospiraceae bacterium]